MSVPKNHHYVSQGHIKNFFNDKNEIHLYDKQLKRFFSKNTSKSIFSEKNLNTKRDGSGNYDYSSIEAELNKYFEKDFPKWFQIISKFIDDRIFDEEVNTALLSIAGYGIIAELRTPHYKKGLDDAIYKGMKDMMDHATDELRSGFENAFSFNDEVKYTNTGSYISLAKDILKAMGDLQFCIEVPKEDDDYYILPDFGAATIRERINNYFNPDAKDISYVGIPLSSKMYIHFFSNKLQRFPRPPGIYFATKEQVYLLNNQNFNYAQRFVACESKLYLENLANSIS